MSTKEQVQENNIWELGAKTQIPENWNLPDSLPDSGLFPDYMATELILTQKDDFKVAPQQRRKSRHPGRQTRQRTQVPMIWQAVEAACICRVPS